MNCKKCGNPITPFDKFCQSCGEVNDLYTGGNDVVNNAVPSETPVDPATTVVNPEPVAPVVNPESVAPSVTPEVSQPVVTQEPVMPNNTVNQGVPVAEVVNNGPVTQTIEPAKKKSNKGFLILIIIMAIVIIGLGVFLAINLLGNDKDEGSSSSATNTPTEPTEPVVENPTPVANGNTIDFAGYTFTLPSGLDYDESTNTFDGGDYAFTLASIYPSTYEKIVSTKDTFAKKLNEKYGETSFSEKLVGNKKYAIFTITNGVEGYPADVFFTNVDDSHVVLGVFLASANSFFDEGYKTVDTVVSSATKSTTSTFAGTDLDDASDALYLPNLKVFE